MLKYLGNKHNLTVARYQNGEAVGNKYGVISEVPASDPAAFSIVAVDKIDCVDTTADKKLPEIPINLSIKHDWSNEIKPEYQGQADKILCAVGYFPQKDTPVIGPYADIFGPGEFKLSEISIYGPMALQEKLAETLRDILNADQANSIDSASLESLVPASIVVDSAFVDKNLKTGGKGVVSQLTSVLKEMYGEDWKQKVTGSDTNAFGIEINYM
jgi:hypothetical protein